MSGLGLKDKFRLGDFQLTLEDLFDPASLKSLRHRHAEMSEERFNAGLVELVRFLFLSAYSDSTLFFPGTKELDDLWHSVIVETGFYERLCNRIRPGTFIHHVGIAYQDYSKSLGSSEVHQEELSWLSSYVHCFGDITESAFEFLVLAQDMAGRMGQGVQGLNRLAKTLIHVEKGKKSPTNFNQVEFLQKEVRAKASRINDDPIELDALISKFIDGLRETRVPAPSPESPLILSNEELQGLYEVSGAFAFKIGQHFAAVERLSSALEWQQRNPELWNDLSRGHQLVGLGTTHLAKAGQVSLNGEVFGDVIRLKGLVPWLTGYGLYKHFVIGFETADETVIAVLDLPHSLSDEQNSRYRVDPFDLACLQGTATAALFLDQFEIPSRSIVSRSPKGSQRPKRLSRFKFPELGIAKSAMDECVRISSNSENPRHRLVRESLPAFIERYDRINAKQADLLSSEESRSASVEKDSLIQDAVRLLVLADGGRALLASSLASRLRLESMLHDVVIQAPDVFAAKIADLSNA